VYVADAHVGEEVHDAVAVHRPQADVVLGAADRQRLFGLTAELGVGAARQQPAGVLVILGEVLPPDPVERRGAGLPRRTVGDGDAHRERAGGVMERVEAEAVREQRPDAERLPAPAGVRPLGREPAERLFVNRAAAADVLGRDHVRPGAARVADAGQLGGHLPLDRPGRGRGRE
jgi:hypothetical protein